MRMLCAVYRVKWEKNMRDGYWLALKDMSLAEFDHAATVLLQTANWLPKPAEFRAVAKRGWT